MEKDAHANFPLLGEDGDLDKIAAWAEAVECDGPDSPRVQWARSSSSTHLWSWIAQFCLFGASLLMFSATAIWRTYPVEHCVKELSMTCEYPRDVSKSIANWISSSPWCDWHRIP